MDMPAPFDDGTLENPTMADSAELFPDPWEGLAEWLSAPAPFTLGLSQLHAPFRSEVVHLAHAPRRSTEVTSQLVCAVAAAGLDRKVFFQQGTVVYVERVAEGMWWVWAAVGDASSLAMQLQWASALRQQAGGGQRVPAA